MKRRSLKDLMPPKDPEPATAPRKVGRPPGKSSQLATGEYRQLKALVPADLHKRAKHAAIDHDKEMSEIVAEALQLWLEQK